MTAQSEPSKISIFAPNVNASDLKITNANNRLEIIVAPSDRKIAR